MAYALGRAAAKSAFAEQSLAAIRREGSHARAILGDGRDYGLAYVCSHGAWEALKIERVYSLF